MCRRPLIASSLSVSCLFASAVFAQTTQPSPVKDPVPPVEKGDIVVATREIAQIPRIADAPNAAAANDAHARIQNLVPAPDGSDDFFVNDMRGVIYRIHRNGDSPAQVTPYLDLRSANVGFTNVFHGNETGLSGFAFHPDFLHPGTRGFGKLYVAYSAPPGSGPADYLGSDHDNHENVIGEWSTKDPKAASFTGTVRQVFRVGQPGNNHNVGTIAFNPNVAVGDADYGMLYISFGDGKAQYDPLRSGQRKTDPLGGLLRINPLQGAEGGNYTVPADNPFVGQKDASPVVFCFGLRHPQNFTWDRGGSHRLFIAEMGQDQVEEVNIGVRGGNYGWSNREGMYATGMALNAKIGSVYPKPEHDEQPYIYPVAQYDHDDGKAISSVVVYRGTAIPQLRGKLLCADIVVGRIFYADEAELQLGTQTPLKELRLSFDRKERPLKEVSNHSGGRVDLRLGTDTHGEVFLLTKGDGKIRELVPAR